MVLRAPKVHLKIPLTAKHFLVRFWCIKNERIKKHKPSVQVKYHKNYLEKTKPQPSLQETKQSQKENTQTTSVQVFSITTKAIKNISRTKNKNQNP